MTDLRGALHDPHAIVGAVAQAGALRGDRVVQTGNPVVGLEGRLRDERRRVRDGGHHGAVGRDDDIAVQGEVAARIRRIVTVGACEVAQGHPGDPQVDRRIGGVGHLDELVGIAGSDVGGVQLHLTDDQGLRRQRSALSEGRNAGVEPSKEGRSHHDEQEARAHPALCTKQGFRHQLPL